MGAHCWYTICREKKSQINIWNIFHLWRFILCALCMVRDECKIHDNLWTPLEKKDKVLFKETFPFYFLKHWTLAFSNRHSSFSFSPFYFFLTIAYMFYIFFLFWEQQRSGNGLFDLVAMCPRCTLLSKIRVPEGVWQLFRLMLPGFRKILV